MITYKLIVAIDQNNAIGLGNQMPWHIPEDFKHFKETTLNHTIIMGSKTALSLGKKLPNRENIVLSRNNNFINQNKGFNSEGFILKNSLEKIEKYLLSKEENKNKNIEVFIIGGGEIYKLAMEWVLNNPENRRIKLIVSHINIILNEADTYFPSFKVINEDHLNNIKMSKKMNNSIIDQYSWVCKERIYFEKNTNNKIDFYICHYDLKNK